VSAPSTLACVEVGGSGCETVVFDGPHCTIHDGAVQPAGARLALAVPGWIDGHRVVAASNLGWYDVDPAEQLGLDGPAAVVCNDAQAAALGEAALRGDARSLPDLVYIGLGTGVGGAVVIDGAVVADNLFGHAGGFSDLVCRCERTGCLETVAAGWALPRPLRAADIETAATAIARAVRDEPAATSDLVVIGGGIARRYAHLVDRVGAHLAGRTVQPSLAPMGVKSATAWGLWHLVDLLPDAVVPG
jgi:predicted NBD/HSP70 family sugar kinase